MYVYIEALHFAPIYIYISKPYINIYIYIYTLKPYIIYMYIFRPAQLKKVRTLIKGGLGAVERMEDAAPGAAAGRREALAAAWAAAFAGLWPLLEAAMGRYGGEEDVMEDLCLVVRPRAGPGRAGPGRVRHGLCARAYTVRRERDDGSGARIHSHLCAHAHMHAFGSHTGTQAPPPRVHPLPIPAPLPSLM
jgi:hypothetical protein